MQIKSLRIKLYKNFFRLDESTHKQDLVRKRKIHLMPTELNYSPAHP